MAVSGVWSACVLVGLVFSGTASAASVVEGPTALPVGGREIAAPAPLDTLPLFFRAGSILPMGPVVQHVTEKPFHLSKGANTGFLWDRSWV